MAKIITPLSRCAIIERAVERATKNMDTNDASYVLRWLAFEAFLVLNGGHFREGAAKAAARTALDRAVIAIDQLDKAVNS